MPQRAVARPIREAYHAANREKRLADMAAYRAARRAARKQPR
jgi:hypothetical protein